MEFKPLKIGNLEASIPIIQGGMGVGVSLSKLAGAVAACGGIGTISAAHPGYDEPDFEQNPLEANLRALKRHVKEALKKAKNGLVAVNIMAAGNDYDELVKASTDAGANLIISGAGLPMSLPALCKGTATKIAPIVSSSKVSSLILKMWDKRHGTTADAVVFEGPDAGGHLGFKLDQIDSARENFYDEIVKILETIKPYEEKYEKSIPLIVAGGIFTGEDIAKVMKLGASGVQMGTRFVATHECDAHENFKMAYVNATKEDVGLVKSPVGLPGRGIRNRFAVEIETERKPVKKCYKCLQMCNPAEIPYCISGSLLSSVRGETKDALVFCGSNAYKIDKIVSVKELMDELVEGIKKA
ncbi:NAD(P)H-dependent flavin oxidoreductase [Clostridium cylindrosporum]|uniref:Probable nitronate monooxygenase n=1 Tax=Clostridium cylindrosporum DSM 605 TaxID=1121307 RepID=A0A0J8DD54_CLOCY|nr:nitronate monooxygenase family protein [Clostridium cylindrosporum]KMT22179.1 oxidoreductase, 2-nitropropane dioxygenase family [Clostridium cylindrosporum DSM 605]